MLPGMKTWVLLLILASSARARRVAIVGAGVSGASAAMHLRELHKDLDIDV